MATAFPDAMDQASRTSSPVSPVTPPIEPTPPEQPKLKGRRRLLQSLQRISSSPSLARRARSSSTGYRRGGKASLSCVSLSSSSYTPCLGNGSSSHLYGGLNGPCLAGSQAENHQGSPRIRLVGADSPNSANMPKSVPLPVDLKPTPHDLPSDDNPVEYEPAARFTPSDHRGRNFWVYLPQELKMKIFHYLSPREIIRCSGVSKSWYEMCYDGQLWSNIDTPEYYDEIPSQVLVKIIISGGPFIRNLNLRGCRQLPRKWLSEGRRISDACRNVVNFSAEGCHLDTSSMHSFLLRNSNLEYINIPGLPSVTNSAMEIIAKCCPSLRVLNVSWCPNVDTRGLKKVVESCGELRDLRASEVRGFDDTEFMLELFKRNTLERLIASYTDVTGESLRFFANGGDDETDILTNLPIVPPRRLKYLNLYQCMDLTNDGLEALAHNVPDLEGLQISKCLGLGDDGVIPLVRTTPNLTLLECEDLGSLTNDTLIELARSPGADRLEHLNISFCENLGDVGMIQVFKTCTSLRFVAMDNTRASDLSLMEASSQVRKRGYTDERLPNVGLQLVIYDCGNITWAGVREVLSSNAYLPRSRRIPQTTQVYESADASTAKLPISTTTSPSPSYPKEIIKLKCCHPWQGTVEEHTRLVLSGNLAAASRFDRKWADLMMVTEEGSILGAGARRRQRRAREAEQNWNADEGEEDADTVGGVFSFGGRRRAQSGGTCIVM